MRYRYSQLSLDLVKEMSDAVESARAASELRSLCHHMEELNRLEREYDAAVRQARRECERIPPEIFLANYPPDDPRHVHDTDAGGNCRGRTCTYNAEVAWLEGKRD